MVRKLLALVLGTLMGAAGFHTYYLRLAPTDRCTWDHPVDANARAACRAIHSDAIDPEAEGQRQLDRLIENVSR